MRKSFKMMRRNQRSALGLLLVISVLFLQQASASVLSLCDSSSSLSGKVYRCCLSSSHSRNGNMGMKDGKNTHCKAITKKSSQKPGIGSFTQRAKTIAGIQRENQFSIPQVCCQIERPKAEVTDFIISLPTVDLVACPSAVMDSSSISPPVSHVSISHPRSRPVYLVLSSFLI
jgi:hypothetical protein